jgi:hypothetical protein
MTGKRKTLRQNKNVKERILQKDSLPNYHGKKESSNETRAAPIISIIEIHGNTDRQKQTHIWMNNYKETAGDTHEHGS